MITKTKVNVSIDKKMWKQASAILKDMGLKKSTFISMVIKSLVDSKTKPMTEIYNDVSKTVYKEMIKKKKG